MTTHLGGRNDDASASAVAIDGSGRIVIAGEAFSVHRGSSQLAVARYKPNGSLDSSFGTGGIVETDLGSRYALGTSMALDRSGKIVVGGEVAEVAAFIARYERNGRLDTTFGSGGEAKPPMFVPGLDALAIDSLGRIIAAGNSAAGFHFALARYDANGALDPSFGSDGAVTSEFGSGLSAVAVAPSNAIIAAGVASFPSPYGEPYNEFALARFASDGSLDPGFGSAGEVSTDFGLGGEGAAANDVAIDSSGGVVAAGTVTINFEGGDHRLALASYNPNGSLDTTFGSGGLVATAFPPETSIDKVSIDHARRRATFTFTGGSWLFRCRLLSPRKSKPNFRNCASPKTYVGLTPSRYTFEVRAVGAGGPDPTPARKKFEITK